MTWFRSKTSGLLSRLILIADPDFRSVLIPRLRRVLVSELSNGPKKYFLVRLVLLARDQTSIVGAGSSESLRTATSKAVSEAIESFWLDEKNLIQDSRSGWAVHMNLKAAALAALCEVVERDAFLVALFSNQPRSHSLESLQLEQDYGYPCKTAEIQSFHENIRVVVCSVEDQILGKILGLGTVLKGESIFAAQKKALSECLMLKNSWNRIPNSKMSLKDSLLSRHALAIKTSAKVKSRLEALLHGHCNDLQPTSKALLLADDEIAETRQIGTRTLARVSIPNALEIKFGEAWVLQKPILSSRLESRGLSLEYFEDHPLL